jgi:hypothetical protein
MLFIGFYWPILDSLQKVIVAHEFANTKVSNRLVQEEPMFLMVNPQMVKSQMSTPDQ